MASEDLFSEISSTEQIQKKCEERDTVHKAQALNNLTDALQYTNPDEQLNEVLTEKRILELPMGKIRNIMKLDTDSYRMQHEVVFMVTRATELFIQTLAVDAFTHTASLRKKTLQNQDVELAINALDTLSFLDGAMDL